MNGSNGNKAQAVVSLQQLATPQQAKLREVAKFLAFYWPSTIPRGDFEQAAALLLFFNAFKENAPHVHVDAAVDETRERVEAALQDGQPHTASELGSTLQLPVSRVYKTIAAMKREGRLSYESKHSGRVAATFKLKGV